MTDDNGAKRINSNKVSNSPKDGKCDSASNHESSTGKAED